MSLPQRLASASARMRQQKKKKRFAFAIRELASEVGRVSGRTRFKGPSVPGRVPSVLSRVLSIWKVQVRKSMRGRLPTRNVAQTLLR